MTSIIRSLGDWLDDRAGIRKLLHEALYEPIPGGARWRYVWGSTLVMAFVTQTITGVFLWMAYSPSTQTAWESVFFIEYEMNGGWLLRGIHHFMAQAMVVLLALHFLQVVWDGAYRAPRELNYVLGVLLMLVVLGLALTGYLLPWDQKGYWATIVGTNLASQAPVVGPAVKKLVVGGSEYGHQTLTRFFALHAGVLPGALVALLIPHLALFRRNGLHVVDPKRRPDATFWPDQVLKDSVAALGVLVVVLALTIHFGGAELTAPADPTNPYDAARPEWYFLFLFQFLKFFPGASEVWGAFIIPGLVFGLLLLFPWIGRSRAGHVINVTVLCVLLGGAAFLTAQAIHEDYYALWNGISTSNSEQTSGKTDSAATAPASPTDAKKEAADEQTQTDEIKKKIEASQKFLDAKAQGHRDAKRVIELALSEKRIPPTGALTLVYEDPLLQGPQIFRRSCASCHSYEDPNDPTSVDNIVNRNEPASAPNLFGLGTKEWIAGILDPERVGGPHYFGYQGSPFAEGDMTSFVRKAFADDVNEQKKAATRVAFDKVAAALAAESKRPSSTTPSPSEVAEGTALLTGGLGNLLDSGESCTDCHKFHDYAGTENAPDLTDYMSAEWLTAFISNPAGGRFYGAKNDRMPAFAPHSDAALNQLDPKSLDLLVRWLRGDW